MSYAPYNSNVLYNNNGWMVVEQLGVLTRVTVPVSPTYSEEILPLFKQHARIDFSDDDNLCSMYLAAAISRIEQYTGMPITPNDYTWEVAEQYRVYEKYQLPLRNCNMVGIQHGFDDLQAPKWVDAPAIWPLNLNVGFANLASTPLDILLGIYELALSLYQQRSNTEMTNVYADIILQNNFGRYWVPRV